MQTVVEKHDKWKNKKPVQKQFLRYGGKDYVNFLSGHTYEPVENLSQ